ncbi:GNAT family N-acetyltransferase [Saccharopolyspora cebuensis]|uniref:GNAT family N-acetyltransferase n=1 Tax=Saccharopolyspora cebuensis TaxID=418759 RepID=A0ABV4CC13_9PSEU
MRHPDGIRAAYEWRPLRPEDAACWENLVYDFEADERPVAENSADQFVAVLAQEVTDPELDTLGVFEGDDLIAYSMVRTGRHYDVEGCVHPDFQRCGLGTRLLAWGCARAEERAAADGRPAELRVWSAENDEVLRGMLDGLGLRAFKWYYEIFSELARTPPLAPVPLQPGWRLGTYDPARDDEVRELHNRSFAGQHEDGDVDAERWRREFTGGADFLPELSLLAYDDADRVVSHLLSYAVRPEEEETWPDDKDFSVGYIGTPPEHRGRSLYRALLAENDRLARELGYTGSTFSVDLANPTGALRLFERLGVCDPTRDDISCWVCYRKELVPEERR